jgi:hypothetical protein
VAQSPKTLRAGVTNAARTVLVRRRRAQRTSRRDDVNRTHPIMSTLHRLSPLATLCLALSAQDPAKVAPPLPPVDLDAKVATPWQLAPITPPKVDAPARRAMTAEPSKAATSVALPGGRAFTPRIPEQPVFGGSAQEIEVLGSTYKASLSGAQFRYVPYFGAQAPRNYPLTFTFSAVQLGSTVSPLAAPTLRRDGTILRIARGVVEERYRVGLDRIEQQFVIDAPFAGDLTISLRVATDLQASQLPQGLRFAGEHGAVSYSNAVLVDATGRQLPMRTELHDGAVSLHASAATIASAAFPITVDPVLVNVTASTSVNYVLTNPDVAYSELAQQYLVVWTRVFSATDTDLHGVAVDGLGNIVGTTLLDNTSDRWDEGRVAVCGNNFLAVASRQAAAGGIREIWGVTRDVNTGTLGAQFQISTGAGDKVSPDVGGEFDGPSNFGVVWQRNFSATDHDIHFRLVSASGALNGATGTIDNSVADDYAPSIAKSTGRLPGTDQVWPIAWQRLVGGQNDVMAARLQWNGTLLTSTFAIDASTIDNDLQASVSSITDDLGGSRYWLIAFTTSSPGNFDVYVKLYRDGATPSLVSANFLPSIEGLTPVQRSRNQSRAQTDTDGCRFAVSYVEQFSATDHDIFATTVHLTQTLTAVDSRVTIDSSLLNSLFTSTVAARSGGGRAVDYALVWDSNAVSGVNASIGAALYAGATAGGGFSTRATGCGGLSLSYAAGSQIPAPGLTLQFDVSGGVGTNLLVVGAPTTLALCAPASCMLGATTAVVLPGSTLVLPIPCQASLVGSTVAVQGAGIGAGGCASLGQLLTTDTVDVTVR